MSTVAVGFHSISLKVSVSRFGGSVGGSDGRRVQTLVSRNHFIFDGFPVFQSAKSVTLDARKVYEDIAPVWRDDKSETFFHIKPFYESVQF